MKRLLCLTTCLWLLFVGISFADDVIGPGGGVIGGQGGLAPFADPTEYTQSWSFSGTTPQYADIGVGNDNIAVAYLKVWLTTPASGSTTYELWELVNLRTDDQDENDAYKRWSFSLPMSYLRSGVTGSGTTLPLVNTTGLSEGQKLRLLGGTAETVTITGAPWTDGAGSGVSITALDYVHSPSTGVAGIYEFTNVWYSVDEDNTQESHFSLAPATAPYSACSPYLVIGRQ